MNIVERLNDDSQCFCSIRKEAANEIESLKQTVIERERQLVEREFQLIELRKMNEQNHEWGNELWEALHTIGYGPPHEGDPLELLNQFVELARTKVSPKEKQ